ncbi:MAG: hypothetical protein ACLQPH_19880 [Acidimicrobiales bacterium]
MPTTARMAHKWRVRESRVRITAHTLDLEQPPDSILRQIDDLAELLASSSLGIPPVAHSGVHRVCHSATRAGGGAAYPHVRSTPDAGASRTSGP